MTVKAVCSGMVGDVLKHVPGRRSEPSKALMLRGEGKGGRVQGSREDARWPVVADCRLGRLKIQKNVCKLRCSTIDTVVTYKVFTGKGSGDDRAGTMGWYLCFEQVGDRCIGRTRNSYRYTFFFGNVTWGVGASG